MAEGKKELRDYTHKFVFEKYLNDKCPVCGEHKDSDDFNGHTESGGKLMAMYFSCNYCRSEYTVGLRRGRMCINSEVTVLKH